MTLLDILNRELEGKKLRSVGASYASFVGGIIQEVQLDSHEPLFELVIRLPNGRIELLSYGADQPLDVE